MKEIIEVQTGEVKSGTGETILKSGGIGSCVVIAAYDSNKKVGAIAHVMLSGMSPQKCGGSRTRYAAEAIDALIKEIVSAGANINDIEVCLAGGANVLKRDNDNSGKHNIDSVKKILNEKKVKVAAETLGGTQGRSLFLDVETGTVFCRAADESEKVLWKFKGERESSYSCLPESAGNIETDDMNTALVNESDIKGRVNNRDKTKEQLISELGKARQQAVELEKAQKAGLNIWGDLDKKKKELEEVQKAHLNIM